ncbi:MAG: hypothetical protein M0Z92_12090, partial [Actinomycetota bacterium]|nr:hypothetical protein [Actinomycetota bacterium]
PTPVTWPVGIPGDFRGVIDRRDSSFVKFSRTARGTRASAEEIVDSERAAHEEGEAYQAACEGIQLLDEVGAVYDQESFLSGTSSPLFVGSALTNFGVRHLLDAILEMAPAPSARTDVSGMPRAIDSAFSGFVFKIQANIDRFHRDHLAFVRVCSGRFERGMVATHGVAASRLQQNTPLRCSAPNAKPSTRRTREM